jgi:hypothetical protein
MALSVEPATVGTVPAVDVYGSTFCRRFFPHGLPGFYLSLRFQYSPESPMSPKTAKPFTHPMRYRALFFVHLHYQIRTMYEVNNIESA